MNNNFNDNIFNIVSSTNISLNEKFNAISLNNKPSNSIFDEESMILDNLQDNIQNNYQLNNYLYENKLLEGEKLLEEDDLLLEEDNLLLEEGDELLLEGDELLEEENRQKIRLKYLNDRKDKWKGHKKMDNDTKLILVEYVSIDDFESADRLLEEYFEDDII